MKTPPRTLDGHTLGLEARAADDDHLAVRTWLRLLSLSTQIEQDIRTRLRERFGTTLARFDYLAQLERHPDGLRMSALSRCLMVTGGNVTGLTDELEKAGFVAREAQPEDRRSFVIALTPKGRKAFERMATVHESWVIELLGGMPDQSKQQLYELLGQMRSVLAARNTPAEAELVAPKTAKAAKKVTKKVSKK